MISSTNVFNTSLILKSISQILMLYIKEFWNLPTLVNRYYMWIDLQRGNIINKKNC